MRQGLEETDMGYGLEVDMIRTAGQMGLLTCPYVFNPDEAAAMARADADVGHPNDRAAQGARQVAIGVPRHLLLSDVTGALHEVTAGNSSHVRPSSTRPADFLPARRM